MQRSRFRVKRVDFPDGAAIPSTAVAPHLNGQGSIGQELQELLCHGHHVVLGQVGSKGKAT